MGKHNTGEIAAAMAAAPQAEPAQPVNRFRRMFGGITFSQSSSDKVYENADGTKQKKLAAVVISMLDRDGRDSGGVVHGSINAVQAKGAAGAGAEFKFTAARFQPAITATSPQAKTELDEFRAYVAEQYIQWMRDTNTAPTTATNVRTAVPGLDLVL